MKKQMVGLLCAIATGAVNVSVAETINYKVSDTITATLDDDGVFIIKGEGAMPDWKSVLERPWNKEANKIKAVATDGNITTIGAYSFWSCDYLKSLSLPTVQTIGASAFGSCSQLDFVFLPEVKTLRESAFYGCNWLISICMPSVTTIEKFAFEGCEMLYLVTVSWPLSVNPDRELWGAFEFVEFLPPINADELTRVTYTPALALGGGGNRLYSVEEYEFGCKQYGIIPLEKPQIVPEGSIAVRREAISAANAETVKIEDGVIHLGISVSRSEDITAPTADWNKVTISKDDIDVSEDGTQIIVKIPANAQQGFMILQSKDAKVNTED